MKRWLTILIIIVVIAGLFYLVQTKVLNWQPLTILFAILAAPFKLIIGLFKNEEEEIRKEHEETRNQEADRQTAIDNTVKENAQIIHESKVIIDGIDEEIKELKKEQEKVRESIENMNREQLREEGRNALGP